MEAACSLIVRAFLPSKSLVVEPTLFIRPVLLAILPWHLLGRLQVCLRLATSKEVSPRLYCGCCCSHVRFR